MAIDEKKLIEYLEKKAFEAEFFVGEHSSFLKVISFGNVKRIIEHQPKVGEWIPCSERLPVPPPNADYGRGEYIGTIITEEQKTFVTSVIFDYIKNDWVEEVIGWEIIAWQELPKPYRKDGEK